MAGFRVACKIDGLKDMIDKVNALDKKMRNKILRKAVNAAGKIVLKAARAGFRKGWNVDTGWLKKSMGSRVKVYRRSGVVVAIVGARRKMRKDRKTKSRVLSTFGRRLSASGLKNVPTSYAHLVEFGTKGRVNKHGANRGTVVPRAFLRPALIRSKGAVRERMRAIITAELAGASAGGEVGDGGND